MRAVAVDVGAKRIGLAVSDSTGLLARPLDVVRVSGMGAPAAAAVAARIRQLMEEEGDELHVLVVGLPRALDGRPTDMTARVEAFASRLRDECGVPVCLQDERLSSREAEALLARREKSWRARKALLDAASAAVILQDYLDAQPRESASTPDGLGW